MPLLRVLAEDCDTRRQGRTYVLVQWAHLGVWPHFHDEALLAVVTRHFLDAHVELGMPPFDQGRGRVLHFQNRLIRNGHHAFVMKAQRERHLSSKENRSGA